MLAADFARGLRAEAADLFAKAGGIDFFATPAAGFACFALGLADVLAIGFFAGADFFAGTGFFAGAAFAFATGFFGAGFFAITFAAGFFSGAFATGFLAATAALVDFFATAFTAFAATGFFTGFFCAILLRPTGFMVLGWTYALVTMKNQAV